MEQQYTINEVYCVKDLAITILGILLQVADAKHRLRLTASDGVRAMTTDAAIGNASFKYKQNQNRVKHDMNTT